MITPSSIPPTLAKRRIALPVLPSQPLAVRSLWMTVAVLLLLGAQARSEGERPIAESLRPVSGIITDGGGARLPRVQVQVQDKNGKLAASAFTNGEGYFRIELPEGAYRIQAKLAGFRPLKDHPLEVTEWTPPLNLTLEIPSIEEQIVVTATKTDAALSQIGSSVTVITNELLRREGLLTVADALRRTTGLTMIQTGPAGQVTSLFVRGGGSNYTKVLIDGIAVNEPGGGYNFANLSTAGIERIEVVRGPQSALFGSDAVSGVVQIFTQRGRSDGLYPSPGVLVEGGSFSTFRYGGGLQGKSDLLDYAVSFARFDTDNNAPNGSFNNGSMTANVGVRPSHRTELRAVFRSEAGRAGVPGSWAFYRPDPDEYYRRRDLSGGLTFTHNVTHSWTQKLAYTISDSRQFSEDPSDSGSFVPTYEGRSARFPSYDYVYRTLNQTRRQRMNYQSDLALPRGHLLTLGGDFERESGSIGDPGANPLKAIRDNAGGYLQDQWALGNRVFTTTGVRIEHNQNFGFYATPRFSLAVHVRQSSAGFWGLTKIKANYGMGIKEPSLIESYSQSPYFKGNPDLKPEKSVCFDSGIEQYFADGRGMLELTFFESRYRDQINFVTTNYSTFEGTYINLGRTRARGVETGIGRELGARWDIAGGYTYLDSKVLESAITWDPAFAAGQQLFRRPKHSGYGELRWKPGRWVFQATGIFVGNRVDSDFVGLELTRSRCYGILNFSASFRFSANIALYSVVENVLDRNYMEVLGYPALPRHFRIGLRAGI
jgi:vitamin B12 transporter